MTDKNLARTPLRIAIDGRTIIRERTGIGTYIERLVRSMLEIDPTNSYTLFLAEPADQISAPNLRKIVIPGLERRSRKRYWVNITLPRFIQKEAIDVLFSPAYTMPYLPRLGRFFLWLPKPPLISTLLELAPNVRYVVTIHDMIVEHSPHFFTWGMRLRQRFTARTAALQAHRIIADSCCTKDDIVKFYGVPEGRITVIYPDVDGQYVPVSDAQTINRVRTKYNLTKPYILYLGTIEPRKNVGGILRAYTRLQPGVRSRYSLLIGGGTGWHAEETERQIRELGSEHDIRRLGYIAHEDLPALYSMADLFVFPSFYEGFGYPPLEAMACGAPVITSNTSSLPEVVGDAAIMIDPEDTSEIASAMEKVLSDGALRDALRAKGLLQARKFQAKKCATETLRILTQ